MAEKTHSAHPKRRLGRGLASLIKNSAVSTAEDAPIGRTPIQVPVTAAPSLPAGLQPQPAPDSAPIEVPIDNIAPNPYQPRRDFNSDELAELTASVSQQGVLQPLLVTPTRDVQADKPYILVAGERRLRAARQAGLHTVPCAIRKAEANQILEWALIENIQRTDLNPLDRAKSYRDYLDRFSLTQAQASERMGEPRTTIANYLRILDLPDHVQQLLAAGRLTFGHAKVLAALADQPKKQLALAGKTADRDLSVRQLEALLAAEQRGDKPEAPTAGRSRSKPPYVLDLEERLSRTIGTRVIIRTGRAKHTGKITIEFYSLDDFDRITAALGLAAES
jgi:ParB family chromosome partitioning protein